MDYGDVSSTKELADAHKRKKTKGVAMLFQPPIHRAGLDLSKKEINIVFFWQNITDILG